MRPRLLVIGTLAGTVVLFAWQSISHGVIKLPEMGLREFPKDSTSTATAQAIRALAPQNGVYFSAYGVFGAVHISADYADKRKQFGSMMGKQLALDLAVVFLLTLLVDRLRGESIVRTAGAYSVLALAWAGLIHVGNEIWWSFPTAWTLGNVADQAIAFFLVGATVAWLQRRFGEPRIETAERPGVYARGGVASKDVKARAPR